MRVYANLKLDTLHWKQFPETASIKSQLYALFFL